MVPQHCIPDRGEETLCTQSYFTSAPRTAATIKKKVTHWMSE